MSEINDNGVDSPPSAPKSPPQRQSLRVKTANGAEINPIQVNGSENLSTSNQTAVKATLTNDIENYTTSDGLAWSEKRGTRPGDRYLRINRIQEEADPNTQATHRGSEVIPFESAAPRKGLRKLKSFLIGKELTTAHAANERLGKVQALAVLSSDALSSVAYATESALFVLVYGFSNQNSLGWIIPISLVICLLIAIVAWSYRQTIHAYPNGGGSYIVAKDNLGITPGLLAAGALMIDYVLTVAVSVSAGVQNLTSAVPSLASYSLWINIGLVLLLMLGNLRGIRESGAIFAIPTYFFIFCFLALIGVGLIQLLNPGHAIVQFEGCPTPAIGSCGILQPDKFNTQAVGIVLLLQAFAAGCSALTGVEAISNGVPAFRKPEAKNASTTLMAMAVLLIIFFIGTSILADQLHALPTKDDSETIISELGRTVFGNNSIGYFAVQAATTLILILAANTSFADFPRLASILSRDKYLPHIFSFRGDRLAFTTGIGALGGLAIVLLIMFPSTQALIPLYAVGVFLAFTLSQTGMVVHWQKEKRKGGEAARGTTRSQLINGLGAVSTGIVLLVIAGTKFLEGAWLVVLLIPILYVIFKAIHNHYEKVASQLRVAPAGSRGRDVTVPNPNANTLGMSTNQPYQVVVPIGGVNRVTLSALNFAKALNDEVRVTAVFVSDDSDAIEKLRDKWAAYNIEVPLVILDVPIRSVLRPFLAYLDNMHEQRKDEVLMVVLPEFVAHHWWEQILHNQTALRLKLALYNRADVVVMNVPYRLQ